jgi:hypothetical protein
MTRSEWIAGVVRKMHAALALTSVVPFRIRFFSALLAALAATASAQAQQQPRYYYAQPRPFPCDVVTYSPAGTVVSISPLTPLAPSPSVQPFNVVPANTVPAAQPAATAAAGALAEVNAKRAARGLRPYAHDPGLTAAAQACAQFRANNFMFGHTSNDFAFVPAGTSCSSTGCAAYPASYGWMSCDVYDNYTFAGAAWAWGRDGKRYMHIFVR